MEGAPEEIAGSIFSEVFTSLPRQGPGNRACTLQALHACGALPDRPRILDLGCGAGGQTLHLAGNTNGSILALDLHAPAIERLQKILRENGLSNRVEARVGNMDSPDVPENSVDLIWSEGAFYNLGIERALQVCRPLLRPGGRLAFTDAVWRTDAPSPEVRAVFDPEYPAMGGVPDVLRKIDAGGFRLLQHFPLPAEAWWEDFYTPMAQRIQELRDQYAGHPGVTDILDQLSAEPDFHRRFGDEYGYEFFIAQRPE